MPKSGFDNCKTLITYYLLKSLIVSVKDELTRELGFVGPK